MSRTTPPPGMAAFVRDTEARLSRQDQAIGRLQQGIHSARNQAATVVSARNDALLSTVPGRTTQWSLVPGQPAGPSVVCDATSGRFRYTLTARFEAVRTGTVLDSVQVAEASMVVALDSVASYAIPQSPDLAGLTATLVIPAGVLRAVAYNSFVDVMTLASGEHTFHGIYLYQQITNEVMLRVSHRMVLVERI